GQQTLARVKIRLQFNRTCRGTPPVIGERRTARAGEEGVLARESQSTLPLSRTARLGAIITGGLFAATLLGAATLSVLLARAVITPPKKHIDDVRILGRDALTITLSATIDSLTPGRYSLWFSGDSGHAQIGEILRFDTQTVTRELIAVEFGDLSHARRGRLSGWYYLTPTALGYPFSEVKVATELGEAPAWLIPSAVPSEQWMIGVHGRAVRRQEALRSVPVFREAGYDCLLISYRNDGDAPASSDNRYSLGDAEWRDVEAAMHFAREHGAEEIVLMGWSMGGATVLQALTRSPHAAVVTGVVLESPVVDWVTALQFQGVAYRLPAVLRLAVLALLSSRQTRWLTGQSSAIDLARMDLVARSAELNTPILLLHSDDDGFVPSTASRALAAARPDLVTYDWFTTARHTRLWNYDRDRWNANIRSWLAALQHPAG
ncbi:MAG: alpha/beta hydrolase, partial [Salinibacterium sp.]|nr:alpha/beta hydrolase [Salinibacterium sp.]